MKLLHLLGFLLVSLLSNNTCAIEKTEVVIFKPNIPAGASKEGKCWTESLAIARSNAWRCMSGNEILDPCFSAEDKNVVVCGVDPLKKNVGFAVRLTEPLPQSKDVAAYNQAWKLLLIDGSICEPYTGTLPFVDKQPVKFGCTKACPPKQKCDKMAGIYSIDTQKPVWLAKKVLYSTVDKDVKAEKVENIAVKIAWQ